MMAKIFYFELYHTYIYTRAHIHIHNTTFAMFASHTVIFNAIFNVTAFHVAFHASVIRHKNMKPIVTSEDL